MKLRTILICLFFAVLALFTVSVVANARTADDTEVAVKRQGFKLKLVGTAIAEDPEYSVAVIESGDGKHRSYHEGEHIGGVLIVEILRARVIVETEQGEDFITLSRSLTLSQTVDQQKPNDLEQANRRCRLCPEQAHRIT